MSAISRYGSASIREIQEECRSKFGRTATHGAIYTLLSRLIERGWLVRKPRVLSGLRGHPEFEYHVTNPGRSMLVSKLAARVK